MSDRGTSRRAEVRIVFEGSDITEDIRPYLRSFSYTDNEEDECDNLSIELQDRSGVWLESWAASAMTDAALSRKIAGTIIRKNWSGKGEDEVLDCGEFELDSLTMAGPPSTLTMDASSLPYAEPVRQTVKYKAWESYNLSGIAGEIAGRAGLTLNWLASSDPYFERYEQFRESDIVFLAELCHENGLSLKATDGELVIFDQPSFEASAPIGTIRRGDGSYVKYSLESGEAKSQYSLCRVSYQHPEKGLIQGSFSNPDAKVEQVLEISAEVESEGEAQAIAKAFLRLANKFEKTASFTFPGNPQYCAGLTVELEGFGDWNGKYMIRQAVHSISGNGGYTTSVKLREVLNGY